METNLTAVTISELGSTMTVGSFGQEYAILKLSSTEDKFVRFVHLHDSKMTVFIGFDISGRLIECESEENAICAVDLISDKTEQLVGYLRDFKKASIKMQACSIQAQRVCLGESAELGVHKNGLLHEMNFAIVRRSLNAMDELAIPDSLSRKYDIFSDKLGRGATCTVYPATCKTTEVQYAVKRAEYHEQFENEARILSKCDHENIIRFIEMERTQHHLWLVFERMSCDLGEYVNGKGRLPVHEARRFAKQICGALDYLHARNIIHRDLKLENVLIDGEHKTVKLADFGFSKYCSNTLKSFVGTEPYMAPEMLAISDISGYTTSVDMFAYGVLVYFMLVGCLPWFDKCEMGSRRFFQKRAIANYKPLMGSLDIVQFLQGLIELKPEARMTAKEALNHKFLKVDVTILSSTNEVSDNTVPVLQWRESRTIAPTGVYYPEQEVESTILTTPVKQEPKTEMLTTYIRQRAVSESSSDLVRSISDVRQENNSSPMTPDVKWTMTAFPGINIIPIEPCSNENKRQWGVFLLESNGKTFKLIHDAYTISTPLLEEHAQIRYDRKTGIVTIINKSVKIWIDEMPVNCDVEKPLGRFSRIVLAKRVAPYYNLQLAFVKE
ncbi:6261_t:CDS:10 [Paraglomus occultum]|uniref:non-specific serine/threonine protein kinase n=1 Tax=Paraglomus occultum TaxID=144539 RepID=A0A9N8WAS6_9GLOM|nr:6261_t:CDS:10 [Paraglomus occultum]